MELLPIIAILSMFVILPTIVMSGIFAIVYLIVKATVSNNSGVPIDNLQRQIADLKRELEEMKRQE